MTKNKRKYTYLALLEPDLELGGYTVTLPDFQGAISEADSLEEALSYAQDLLEIYVKLYLDEGRSLPQASTYDQLRPQLAAGDRLEPISLTLDATGEIH